MKHYFRVIAAIGAALFAAAHAAPVTFIHEGSGRGTIDGVTFSALFTITAMADTNNIEVAGGVSSLDHDSASIDIDGVGVFEFITATRTFVNSPLGLVGFSRGSLSGSDLFNGPDGAAFSTYDLTLSIGPIPGAGQLLQWTSSSVITSGGVLIFDDFVTDAQFTATVGEVPLPGAAVFFAPALAGFVAWRRKRS